MRCRKLSGFGEREVLCKDSENNAHEFLHTVRHGNIKMFSLRAFTVNVSMERRRVHIGHIRSAVKGAAKVTRTVFHHRGVGSGVFAGLVGGWFATGKGKKFVGIVEVLNIA